MAGSTSSRPEAGFSLVEVMIATALMAVSLVSLAQLFAISTKSNLGARTSTFAAILAEQKMEQLKSLNWGFDMLGLPLSDTTTNLARFDATGDCPAVNTGAAVGLSSSPDGVLAANTDGYVDYLSANGCGLGGGPVMPANTVYIRRWSVEPLPTNPNNTLILQVLVTRRVTRGPDGAGDTSVRRMPEEARFVGVKTRKTA